jgi:viologen exporter family transport system permease protein
MLRIIDIYLTYQALSIKKLSYYRGATLLRFVNLFVWVAIDLIFFNAVFSNVNNLAGWSYWDAVLLVFSLSLFWDIFWRGTSGGIVNIPDKILNGDIHRFLLKPLNPLFHVAISEVGILENSFNTPILLIYYVSNNGLPFTIGQILTYFLMMFLGVGIFTWILILIMSLSFWATNVGYLESIYWELQNIARYPKDIFSGFLGNLFMFILPVFFIASIPVDILRKGVNPDHIGLAILLNLVLGIAANAVWNAGLRAFKSTSM